MKSASRFEKVAARAWNLLNEGKPFTPIFTIGVFLTYALWTQIPLSDVGFGFIVTLPLFILLWRYDFPLFLRNYLWIPIIVWLFLRGTNADYLPLFAYGAGLYFFFTVFFWGTIYYHLRIGTRWTNFTRFWKLVLKNSDSTSGNAQEQLPKVALLLAYWWTASDTATFDMTFVWFPIGLFIFAWILHHYLFDWKPKLPETMTVDADLPTSEKVYVLIVDGMRKDRYMAANTPFLERLRQEGTEYTNMETVYPARTVVCFSSMFTGARPEDHGIHSNMVWNTTGVKTDTVFDRLRAVDKSGKILGIAHLVDAFGSTDVRTVTAVMHNDVADRNIVERAKQIVHEEDPDLLAIQLIGTDQTGHSRGTLYSEYVQKIEEADALLAEFCEELDRLGKLEDATLIVMADHGQADGIGGHGHLDEGERFVPFWMYGKNVHAGLKVDTHRHILSLGPTITKVLGADIPHDSRGVLLTEAFKEATSK
ncbi:alkaline phosphatase family protein [Exiguobacterium acetylicum]|uniref:alkaline phosphatase family protein n=1 Tax=Exiguobacterium sp. BMC-KP TaxID=1684312 RepID=UPI0006AA4E48|nr:alkaline phosphatase family protein [Exiguobacterium sp. BMC-KP]KOP31340.1 sulfatase [Exiguobacterium sp. BMC-KP]